MPNFANGLVEFSSGALVVPDLLTSNDIYGYSTSFTRPDIPLSYEPDATDVLSTCCKIMW